MIARVLSVLLGLAIAATSVWEPAGSSAATHDLVVGLLIAAASVVAMAVRGANYFLTTLGLWMFFSGMVYAVVPHIYIGIVGGTLVFVMSLVPTSDRTFWPFGRDAAPAA